VISIRRNKKKSTSITKKLKKKIENIKKYGRKINPKKRNLP